jgi:hypothetical protein
VTAQGEQYPQKIGPVELQDVLWQFLPDEIEAVFVGPDDRTWYQLHHPSVEKRALADIRRNIEDQFSQASPQFFGSKPVLFETNGRVWIPGRHDNKGADLLDLASATFVDSVPDPTFFWIHAIRSDGTLFITPFGPTHPSSIVAAYRAGKSAVTNTLDPQNYRIAGQGFCIDSAGGTSFFAGVENGQIVVSQAPHCYDSTAMYANVRDRDGAL